MPGASKYSAIGGIKSFDGPLGPAFLKAAKFAKDVAKEPWSISGPVILGILVADAMASGKVPFETGVVVREVLYAMYLKAGVGSYLVAKDRGKARRAEKNNHFNEVMSPSGD